MRSSCSSTRCGRIFRRPTWRMPSASSAGANAAMAPLSAADNRNLYYRIASGVVLGPLVLLLAVFTQRPFDIAIAIASGIGLGEWLKLVTGRVLWWAYAVP